jgi:phosphate transport system permease protein
LPSSTDARPSATSRGRLVADRAARWVVSAGGLAIIACILGILVFILIEIRPLLSRAGVVTEIDARLPEPSIRALLTDEYRSHVAVLSPDGWLRVRRLQDWRVVVEKQLADAPLAAVGVAPGQSLFTAATADGRVLAAPARWRVSFSGSERVVTPVPGDPVFFPLDPNRAPVRAFTARVTEDGAGAAAATLRDGSLALVTRRVETDLFTGEVRESIERAVQPLTVSVTRLVMDQDARNLYAGTVGGELLWWKISDGTLPDPGVVPSGAPAVTALSLLLGDRSLVVGRADGSLAIWFPVRQEDGSHRLTRIRDFPPHPGPITLIAPSQRHRSFLAQDGTGLLGIYHSTSHRVRWSGPSPIEDAKALLLAPKGDGAFLGGDGRIAFLAIHDPHPEVSLGALFGKVWYEGYDRPEHAWQSTGGTDDFEPKLSLTPLVVGTLKGTVYSLLLAIPLGVLAAMYTSQFMHASYRRYVKPTVEIMAALPSVVLGFLAGLWLAPRVERVLPALIVMQLALPAAVLAAGLAWRALPRSFRGRFRAGAELLVYMGALLVGAWVSLRLGPAWARWAFGGDVQEWLLEATGLRYDQRNAIVVGLAMGFAVIPIIFSIAEDAFSNVPGNLVAGSLALGANRWQTVTRLILPTASPGIFSAIMIGFGRAVGETMIVLMATGNTPILDWSPFNGFRTLAANIAVEIPEAPHGSTLYRTLFLAALMLFLMTFLVNTLAELIRQRLRRRYAQL